MTELTLRPGPLQPPWRAALRRWVADNVAAYAFMAAGIICFGLFAWYPLVKGVELSFQQNNFVDPPSWVGLDNFRRVWADPLFVTAWKNTFEFTGLALLLGYAVPLCTALVQPERTSASSTGTQTQSAICNLQFAICIHLLRCATTAPPSPDTADRTQWCGS